MSIDANKVIETLNVRHGQKISALEKEVAFLLVQNQQLKDELKALREKEEAATEKDNGKTKKH